MPISFKDQIDIDIGGTFLNPLEFADEHYFNGELITCLVDEDEFRERVSRISSSYAEGVFLQGTVVFVKRGDLVRDPVPEENVTLDDLYFYVLNVEHEMGMLVITLGANKA